MTAGLGDLSRPPHSDRSGVFAGLSTYSRIVARLSWDADAIDLTPDARAWPELSSPSRIRR